MNLLQVMFCVAALAIITATGINWHPSNAHIAAYTTTDLSTALTGASSIAASTADGATVSIQPNGNTSMVTVYRGRPDQTTTPITVENYDVAAPIALADGTTRFAILVAHDGSASYVEGWTPWTQVTSTSTTCTTLALLIGFANAQQPSTLSCDTLALH